VKVVVDRTGTSEGLRAALEEVFAGPDAVRSVAVIGCADNPVTPEEVQDLVAQAKATVFGGLFPALLCGQEKLDRGFLVVGLQEEVTCALIRGLSDPAADFDDAIRALGPAPPGRCTLMVMVDGYSRRIGSFVEALFSAYGLEINYLGGGAGSLSMRQAPCIISNGGVSQDSALLVFVQRASGVGVAHGWKPVSRLFQVTRASGNRIETLDGRPAFQMYSAVVEEHSHCTITSANFFQVAKAYPFGIARMEGERVVRGPIMLGDDGSLTCVGEVSEGCFVDILHGDADSLVKAAALASRRARESFPESCRATLKIFVDCISRALFLEDEFGRELQAVYEPDLPLVGACTLGEIANSGSDYLEFFNKTSVVALAGEP